MGPIVQQDPYGCGIACTAFVFGLNYQQTKKYFRKKGNKPNFYCKDIVAALAKGRKDYHYNYVGNKKLNFKENTIVFIKKSKKFPYGHYLVKSKEGWMDPWINLDINNPQIKKARAGFIKRIPGRITWAIIPNKK